MGSSRPKSRRVATMTATNMSRRSALGSALVTLAVVGVLGGCYVSYNNTTFVGHTRRCPTGSQRQLGVGRQAVDIALKQRIASVKKTGKLTDAMRLVAAAKVKRAQDGVAKTRPFSDELQGMIKGIVKKLKGTGLEAELPMLRIPEKVTSVGILIIASHRGLCGGYNAFIGRKLESRVRNLNQQGIKAKIVVVGSKGLKQMERRLADFDYEYTNSYFVMPDKITATLSSEIGDTLSNLFLSGEVQKVEVLYAKFVNLLKNIPTIRTVLPLAPVGAEDAEDETFVLTSEDGKFAAKKEKVKSVKARDIESDVIFDQPPETILNSMLPLYLNSVILTLLFEAQASELGSRMIAMKAATDNAGELCKNLNILYNKKRQASITAEICEISAGAMAIDEQMADKGALPMGLYDTEETVTDEFLQEVETNHLPDVPLTQEEVFTEDYSLFGRGR